MPAAGNVDSIDCTYGSLNGENLPLNCVTWTKPKPTFQNARLPTEAEIRGQKYGRHIRILGGIHREL